jgi:rhodanese-related sulfurtransferase
MKTCTVSELKKSIQSGRCRVVDVREAPEFEAERIEGAEHAPLSAMDEKMAKELAAKEGELVLVCRSGGRASQAAEKLARWSGCEPVVLSGGMNAWTQAGAETLKGASTVWDLERQVRFAAGLLVLTGVVLGFTVSENFFYLSGFVGAGLVFAALTNTCGMGMLLARMPWNKRQAVCCAAAPPKAPGNGSRS